MARGKIKVAYIEDDSKRKAAFWKRKRGLIKKIDELSTLCGVDACTVIYGENASKPDVWPTTEGVKSVFAKFKRMDELNESERNFDQKGYLKQRIKKVEKQLKKRVNNNKEKEKEKEMTDLMYQCVNAGRVLETVDKIDDLKNLTKIIDQHLKEINEQINNLSQEGTSAGEEIPMAIDHVQDDEDEMATS